MEDITICFIGDLMLGRYYDDEQSNTFQQKLEHMREKQFSKQSLETVYGNTLQKLSSGCDLVVGNLETCITANTKRDQKAFNYRLHPIYSQALKLNERTFFNIANNHIMDYENGIQDTVKALQENNIKFSGVLPETKDYKILQTFTIKNKKIGIFGCADHYERWKSSTNKEGIYYVDYDDPISIEKMLDKIKEMRKQVDILIMSIHWGFNYASGINNKFVKFAKQVIISGVDIIHGHSSHHVKCIQHDTDKVIIYGNGDFVNDYAIDQTYRNDLGMIVKVTINPQNKKKVCIIPTIIKDRQVAYADDKERKIVYNNVKNDCAIKHSYKEMDHGASICKDYI